MFKLISESWLKSCTFPSSYHNVFLAANFLIVEILSSHMIIFSKEGWNLRTVQVLKKKKISEADGTPIECRKSYTINLFLPNFLSNLLPKHPEGLEEMLINKKKNLNQNTNRVLLLCLYSLFHLFLGHFWLILFVDWFVSEEEKEWTIWLWYSPALGWKDALWGDDTLCWALI